MTTRIVTDSNAQFPADLAERFEIEVVSLQVSVDGETFAEGTELTADAFYERFEGGATPTVATSQPSPGAFIDTYARLADAGVDQILSIHIGSAVSGTLNSARLAAQDVEADVRLVDTGTASFGVSCCVWEAAEALRAGASAEEAARVAESIAPTVGNVFVVGALDLARAGGRMRVDADAAAAAGIPVLSLVDGEIEVIATASDVDACADAMAGVARTWGTGLRAAVGTADRATADLADALEASLVAADEIVEVVRYRIGPSVGAHTGPGTAGAFFWPATN
jgi:DegV family protein with EDD domain